MGAYLGQLVQNNLQGMTASQPYAYLVTPGVSDDDKAQNARQLQNVQDTVARGVLPRQPAGVCRPGFRHHIW